MALQQLTNFIPLLLTRRLVKVLSQCLLEDCAQSSYRHDRTGAHNPSCLGLPEDPIYVICQKLFVVLADLLGKPSFQQSRY